MLPLIILAILILLMVFRWDAQATKTINTGVIKWKLDRWTGEYWAFVYSTQSGAFSIPAGPEEDEEKIAIVKKTDVLNMLWLILFAGSVVWFVGTVIIEKKKARD